MTVQMTRPAAGHDRSNCSQFTRCRGRLVGLEARLMVGNEGRRVCTYTELIFGVDATTQSAVGDMDEHRRIRTENRVCDSTRSRIVVIFQKRTKAMHTYCRGPISMARVGPKSESRHILAHHPIVARQQASLVSTTATLGNTISLNTRDAVTGKHYLHWCKAWNRIYIVSFKQSIDTREDARCKHSLTPPVAVNCHKYSSTSTRLRINLTMVFLPRHLMTPFKLHASQLAIRPTVP